jgi:DNA-binding SARP family transcriptional activator
VGLARVGTDPYPAEPALTHRPADMRWMNRLATAVTVLAFVAGPPLLTVAWLLHHPWRPPTRAQIQTWSEQPLTAGTIIAGCALIAGTAWLLLVTYLVRRGLAELRRRLRRLQHLPVPTPVQMTAGSMAGLAAFTLPALPADHPEPPTATGTAQPSDPGAAKPDLYQPVHAQPAGITLPGGGWIPYRTAAAISALATLAWLQTRRHYRPDPRHPRDHDTDPDLQPAPNAVHTVTTALTDDTPADLAQPLPPLPSQHLPHGVLLLTGPGAAAAARGLLVTAALGAAGGGPPTVSMHPRYLRILLPAIDTTDPVLTELSTGTPRPSAGPAPRLGGPDDHPGRRRSTHGERRDPPMGTSIVLDEDHAANYRWYVTADGSATGTGLTNVRRLCTLNPQTAVDLLTLAGARPPVDSTPQPRSSPDRRGPGAPTPDPAAAAHLVLLGGCQLSAAGEPVHIRRTAGLQILVYLAVHADGATRSELTRTVWPHLPAATISQRLHTTLADLRQQLRPVLDDDPITRHDDRYRLNTRAITTDLQQWRTAVDAMANAVGTVTQQQTCRRVVDLYQGEPAAGQTWSWLSPVREQTRRSVIDACATLAALADSGQALTWLQRAITIDPYNEPLHQQAADLLHATGDQVGAADLIKRLHIRLAVQAENA